MGKLWLGRHEGPAATRDGGRGPELQIPRVVAGKRNRPRAPAPISAPAPRQGSPPEGRHTGMSLGGGGQGT
eukprot:2774303-Pyramimonas_sp.AAC.1